MGWVRWQALPGWLRTCLVVALVLGGVYGLLALMSYRARNDLTPVEIMGRACRGLVQYQRAPGEYGQLRSAETMREWGRQLDSEITRSVVEASYAIENHLIARNRRSATVADVEATALGVSKALDVALDACDGMERMSNAELRRYQDEINERYR